jgi:non-homologous end joining protein Ku
MAATVWKGHLTFGLISIPVKMVRAARAEKISFRQLHRADHCRVRQTYLRDEPLETPEFEPGKYKDRYREKLNELIAAKLSGEQTYEAPAPRGGFGG